MRAFSADRINAAGNRMGYRQIFNNKRERSHGLPVAAFRLLLTGLGVAALVALTRLDLSATSGLVEGPTNASNDGAVMALSSLGDLDPDMALNENSAALSETEISNKRFAAPGTSEDGGVTINENRFQTITLTMGRGDTLVDLIAAAGVRRREALDALFAMKGLFDARHIQVGQQVQLELHPGDTPRLSRIAIRTGFDSEVVTQWNDETGYQSSRSTIETVDITMYRQGVITDSLYLSAQRAGIPNRIIVELIRIFSFDVDFQREIREGDQFAVYYGRRMTPDGREVENNEILFARLVLRGKPVEFYRYDLVAEGRADYFAPSGQSARRTLMKTPVDGARISGTFGPRRHPILGYTRQHEGVDFAVPQGTPIMAAGDGVIERASRWGTYGNYVRIRHNDTYKTAYGHLSRYGRGIRSGRRVQQGDIIGYVGATGGVTGPHLHYEVLVDDEQVNPMTLQMPTGRTLKGDSLLSFAGVQAGIDSEIMALITFAALSNTEKAPRPQVVATVAQ